MSNNSFVLSRQQGVTLIELLVAVTISLIIMAGALQLYSTSNKTSRVQEGVSRLQENARYVFARLSQDLSQTGFIGCFNYDSERITNTLLQSTGAGEIYNFTQPIDAIDGNGPEATDTLIIRHAAAGSAIPLVDYSAPTEALQVDSGHANYGPLQQYQVVMVTDCSRSSVFMITNDPDTSAGVIEHRAGVPSPDGQSNVSEDLENGYGASIGNYPLGGSVAYLYGGATGGHSYSIGDSAAAGVGEVCSAATPEFCALFKNDQELVQGVEDFQVEIGWVNAAGNLRYGDPDVAVDWNAVERVKITLTINSIDPVPTSQGRNLTRQTFVKTIMVRNQII